MWRRITILFVLFLLLASSRLPEARAQLDAQAMRQEYERCARILQDRIPDVSPHLVRVIAYGEHEVKHVGKEEVLFKQRFNIAAFGGLVITPDPLVLVSAAATTRDPVTRRPWSQQNARSRVEPKFAFVLRDGTEIPATIVSHDPAYNFSILRPGDGVDVPDELRHPFSVPQDSRRPEPQEFFGVYSLDSPFSGFRVITRVGLFTAGKEFYPRPALTFATSFTDLGMPAFNADGTFAGLVNMQPPEAGMPEWASFSDPRKMPVDTDRDPTEFVGQTQRPVLLTPSEIVPYLARIRADVETPMEFAPLGLVLAVRDWRLRAMSVDDDSLLAGSVLPGDIILRVRGRPTGTPNEFMTALEAALEAGEVGIPVEIERDGATSEILVHIE